MTRRSPPRVTVDDLPRAAVPPNAFKSSAPAVVVQCWCGLVQRMDRKSLDRFTIDIFKRFDERDLGALRDEILRRRRVLALQPWP